MKVLIIEDEEIAAERLLSMLKKYDDKIEVQAILDSVKNSVKYLSLNPEPDLIFLDIHLGDGISFSIFDEIEVSSPVIFTTAYDEYALKAFRLKSVDYLLKPLRQEDLNKALEKLKSWSTETKGSDLKGLIELMNNSSPKYKTRFSVVAGDKIRMFEMDEICYFYTESGVVLMVTNKGIFPVDFTIEELTEQVNPSDFFRINRQFLIKFSAIKNVHLYPKSKLKLELIPSLEKEIFVSQEKTSKFRDWLEGY